MNFYLETIDPECFAQYSQYLPLSGVLLRPETLIAAEADVKKVMDGLLEVLPADARMLVYQYGANFRKMLLEARDFKTISEQILPVLPAEPAGYMAMKACRTAQVDVAAGDLLFLEQAYFAKANGAGKLVLDWHQASLLCDPVALARQLEPFYADLLVYNFMDPAEVRLAMMLGIQNLGLSDTLLKALLENPVAQNAADQRKEQWIMTYLRSTVLE